MSKNVRGSKNRENPGTAFTVINYSDGYCRGIRSFRPFRIGHSEFTGTGTRETQWTPDGQ